MLVHMCTVTEELFTRGEEDVEEYKLHPLGNHVKSQLMTMIYIYFCIEKKNQIPTYWYLVEFKEHFPFLFGG